MPSQEAERDTWLGSGPVTVRTWAVADAAGYDLPPTLRRPVMSRSLTPVMPIRPVARVSLCDQVRIGEDCTPPFVPVSLGPWMILACEPVAAAGAREWQSRRSERGPSHHVVPLFMVLVTVLAAMPQAASTRKLLPMIEDVSKVLSAP
jgi:hypothetical protein